jgi:putative membrane protein
MKTHVLLALLLAVPAGAVDTVQPRSSDAEVLGILAAVNRNEIAAAEVAVKKNASPAVLDFARMMKQEHAANLEETRRLAKKIGAGPGETEAVEGLRKEGKGLVDTLSVQQGTLFSEAYMDAMVKGHADALDLIDNKLLKEARNEEVKKHLEKTREKVASHLAHAQRLQDSLR